MSETGIVFYDREFEHDIYELIRAFFPGPALQSVYAKEEQDMSGQSFERVFFVTRQGPSYGIELTGPEGTRKLLVPLLGQSGPDALISCQEKSEVRADPGPAARIVRKENKDRIKVALYGLLRETTKKELPWGALTGIRPCKLATGMLEEGKSREEARALMQTRYLVSPSRAALSVDIAVRERRILDRLDPAGGYSLYVGIPFCPSICLYCSFSSSPAGVWEKRMDDYLSALEKEILATAALMKQTGKHLDTIYIGGGTPTTLNPPGLARLLDCLKEAFDLSGLLEFTVEAGRPDSITPDKLAVLRRYPVTRISVNPQTMNDETLELIGRRHTSRQTEEAFYMARDAGFDNINMDTIIGLPGEDLAAVSRTMERIRCLGPDSLTVHTLALKRAARLSLFKDRYEELTGESSLKILDLTMEAARKMEMSPYYLYRQKNMKGNFENVGYARVDKEGIYNILIMEERQPIVALGAGGASKLLHPDGQQISRIENVKDVAHYLDRIDEMIERKRRAVHEIYLEQQEGGKEETVCQH